MPIPDYETLMLPLLRFAASGNEVSMKDAADAIAKEFRLTDEDRQQRLPSGQQTILYNRTGWARTYMKKAGLVDSPRKGFIRISPRGREVLKAAPERVDVAFLKQFPEFVEFQTSSKRVSDGTQTAPQDVESQTPEEALESSYATIQTNLETEVLGRIMAASPEFFERLVVDLLVRMGYGGSRHDAGKAVGRSGDEGIDGIINEDRLGLDVIYIQAKRWSNTVDRAEIQKFAGALQGKRARKGIFITTSSFGKTAREYALAIDNKIVLIDGTELARLVVEHDVGVSTLRTIHLKKLDQDYFAEE